MTSFRRGTPAPRTLGSLRTRLRPTPALADVAARLGLSERALAALEACPLDSASVATLRLYAAGLGARVELVHADGRRKAL